MRGYQESNLNNVCSVMEDGHPDLVGVAEGLRSPDLLVHSQMLSPD